MIKSILLKWNKIVAQQLRKPQGWLAGLTASKMNRANEVLYRLTFDKVDLRKNDKVLEIGFGNGKYFQDVFDLNPGIQLYGIDYSQDMVLSANKRFKQFVRSGQLKLAMASSDAMPFEANCFDSVICINVIYFWEDPIAHLREIFRVLKPGGLLYLGFKSKEALQKQAFTVHHFNLYSDMEYEQIIRSAGFELMHAFKAADAGYKYKLEGEQCMVCQKAI